MTKFVNCDIVFQEVPGEVSLAINISNCPCGCKGCHSSYLTKDIGEELTFAILDELITSNKGITCVAFMGGDANPSNIKLFSLHVHEKHKLKTAWYSGVMRDPNIEENMSVFDFVKVGPYIEHLGGLNSVSTNQCFYKKVEGGKFIKDMSGFWK